MTLRSHLVRGIFGTLGLTVASAGLTFVNGVLLARLLGAADYGIYSSAIALVLLVTLPMVLGFDRLVVRNIASARSDGSWSRARGLIRRAVQLVVPVTLIGIVVFALGAALLQPSLAQQALPVLWLALLMVPLTALLILRRAVTLGIKHIVSSQLPESLVRPAIFTLLLALAYLAFREVTAFDAMALNVVSVVVALAVGLWLLWRQLPDDLRHGPPTYETRKWVHEAVPFALAAAAQTLMNQTDVILVGALAGPAQAGLYAVASRGASLTLFGAMAVGTTLMPTAAQLWAHDDYARLQRVVTRAARGAFLFALAVAVVLWIFGPQFLLLFGREFVAANATLAVLAFASVIDCGFGISGLMLSMTGYQGLNFAAMGAAVVTRIALGLLLIPVLGAVGAAVAAVVAITVVNVLATWYAARRLGLDATPLGIARFSRR